jgi:hypothetical protein
MCWWQIMGSQSLQQRSTASDKVSARQNQGNAKLWQIPEGYQTHYGNINPIDAEEMTSNKHGDQRDEYDQCGPPGYSVPPGP